MLVFEEIGAIRLSFQLGWFGFQAGFCYKLMMFCSVSGSFSFWSECHMRLHFPNFFSWVGIGSGGVVSCQIFSAGN